MNKIFDEMKCRNLIKAGAMHGKETQEPSSVAARVIESQKCHVLVLVILIHCSLCRWVCQIGRRGSVYIGVQYRSVTQTEAPRCETIVRSLGRKDGPRHDGICCLFHITQGCDLGKEVLQITAYTGVLVGTDECDVVVRVNARILGRKLRDNRAAYASISHGNVCERCV